MKNEKLISILKEILNAKEEEKNKDINNLIELLNHELLCEEFKGKSKKQRINFCMNLAKKVGKKRPVLECCKYENGFQIYTDSFLMVHLKKDDQLPLKDYKETNYNYPSLELIEKNYNNLNFENVTIKNTKNFLQNLKTYKYLEIENKFILGFEVFNNFVNFLNIDINKELNLKFLPKQRIIVIEKENGSKGLMLCVHESIKVNEKIEKYVE